MRSHFRWLPPVGFGIALLCLWWALTTFGVIASEFLPTPQSTLMRLISGLNQGYLASALGITVQEALLGCFFAAVLGIPLGYAIGKSKLFARIIQPYVAASQAIPAVAIAPLLTIWIGYGLSSIVVLCTIMVIFPVVVSTSVGVRHIDKDIIGAARLDGAGGFTLFRTMELPLAAPGILAGLRTGFTLSITGAVVGEMIIGGNGLGMILISAQGAGDIRGMFAAIVLLAASATSIYGIISLVEWRVNREIKEHRFRVFSHSRKES
ncbi:MAG: ABC transporter permease [Ancrocorticia populi]|uniref:ABC transporter permease n=1 Tax=Ancrocorticia populi TaxID=2175228 RepID=UPI003F93033E